MASAEHVSKQADPPSDAPESLKYSVAGYNILVDKINEQAGMIRTQSEMIDKQKLYITILGNEVEVLKAQMGQQHEETEQGKPSSRQSTSSDFAGFPDEMSQHESDEPLPQKEMVLTRTSPSVDPDLFGGGPSSPIDQQSPRRSSLMSEEMARDPQSYHAPDLDSGDQFVTMAQEKASPDMMRRSGGPPFSNKRPPRNVQSLPEDVGMSADASTPLSSSPPKQQLSVLPSTPRLPSRRTIVQPAFENIEKHTSVPNRRCTSSLPCDVPPSAVTFSFEIKPGTWLNEAQLTPDHHSAVARLERHLEQAMAQRLNKSNPRTSASTWHGHMDSVESSMCVERCLRIIKMVSALNERESTCRVCFHSQQLCARTTDTNSTFRIVPLPGPLREGISSTDIRYFVGPGKDQAKRLEKLHPIWST